MDLSHGPTEAIVSRLVELTKITPEEARFILSGHLDGEGLKDLFSTIKNVEVRCEKRTNMEGNV